MISTLLISQLVISAVIGVAVARAIFRIYAQTIDRDNHHHGGSALILPQRMKWLRSVLRPFSAPATRLAKPSDRVRRALWMLGVDHQLTDLEFSKICWSISMLLTTLAGAAFLVLWLLQITVPTTLIIVVMACSAISPLLLPLVKLRDLSAVARSHIAQGFSSFLDVLALTLESGQNFQSALHLSVQRMPQHGPSASLRRQLQEVLRDIRSGQSRQSALQQLALRVDLQEVTQFAASMTTAESQGVSVTALLRRQAEQLRTSRSLAAERHAMKLPVKLLAPLAICIFPCTFLVIAFPIAIRLSSSGLF